MFYYLVTNLNLMDMHGIKTKNTLVFPSKISFSMHHFLFHFVDARFLYFFRLGIGIWFLVDTISMLVSGYVREAYVDTKVNLSHYGFEWLMPLPGHGMYVLFGVLVLVALCIIMGYHTRLMLTIFLMCFGYIFLLDIAYTLNKFYLFMLLGILLLTVQKAYNTSKINLDTKFRGQVPYWTVFVFQSLVSIIYVYSGLSKISHDWLFHAEPLSTFFSNRSYFRALGMENVKLLAQAFSYGGITFDLFIVPLLIYRRTRPYAQVVQGVFHLLNFTILGIGSLSIFMGVLTFLLFPTDWLKRMLRLKDVQGELKFENRISPGFWIALIVLVSQLLIPHRHYFSGQNVNWTEKGHRFSWRLMTRTKSGSSSDFVVYHSESDQT